MKLSINLMHSSLAMHQSTRCGAKTRRKTPCQSPAMPNGRCRMHGGKSPGAPTGMDNGNYKHGQQTTEKLQERQQVRQLLKDLQCS